MARMRWFDLAWLLCWGIASAAWCLSAAATIGATFDEPGDVAAGLEFWHTGSHAKLLRVGAMPLPMDICALPIFIYERCEGIDVNLAYGNARLPLFLARAATLLFWWLLLYYSWRVGTHLGGPWAGRLAVALLAAEPTFLAHACLATKDIAISACLLALVFHFRVGREGGWLRRIGVPGVWFGIALLAKATALAFGPICMLAVEIERLLRVPAPDGTTMSPARGPVAKMADAGRDWWQRLRPWRSDVLRIGILGLAVMLLYCGSDWLPEKSWVKWAHELPEQNLARAPMIWLSEHICIFYNGGGALVRQIAHNFRGHDGSFLLGQVAPRSFWYYFPVAVSMKMTLGLLLLPVLLLLLQPRSLTNWACVAAGVLLAYSLKCNVQIGVRLMLPAVALGVVGVSVSVVRAWHESLPGWRRSLLGGAAALAVLGGIIASVRVWPHGLCYINLLWGGTERGYLCLSDSNYDWGQGLPELVEWRKKNAADVPLDVWYFGTDPACQMLPERFAPLHEWASSGDEVEACVHGHYLAASTTLLHGPYLPSNPVALFLRSRQPVARTQTFFIYDFTK